MKKKTFILHKILKVILSLILIMPIFGALGVFPEPTKEMYNTNKAFEFIQIIMTNAWYIQYMIALVFIISIYFLWTKREALSVLLLTPITLNIIAFHLFLDGGLFTAGAVMADLLFLLNIYFIWKNKEKYNSLLNHK